MKGLIIGLLASCLGANAQNGCFGQMKPLKPLTPLGCRDMVPLCLCGSRGADCHWEFVCVKGSSTPASGVDTSIYQDIHPPPRISVPDSQRKASEAAIKAQELEILRHQNAEADESNAKVRDAREAYDAWWKEATKRDKVAKKAAAKAAKKAAKKK